MALSFQFRSAKLAEHVLADGSHDNIAFISGTAHAGKIEEDNMIQKHKTLSFYFFLAVTLVINMGICPISASANPVRFSFQASFMGISEVQSSSLTSLIGGPINGFFTFDGATPDQNPDNMVGVYLALQGVVVNIGAFQATFGNNGNGLIHVAQEPTIYTDSYQVIYGNGPDYPNVVPGFNLYLFALRMSDSPYYGTMLQNDNLPLEPPILPVNGYFDPTIELDFFVGNSFAYANAYYHLDSLTLSPVPEPATIILFGTGIAGLAGIRLRRKKQQ